MNTCKPQIDFMDSHFWTLENAKFKQKWRAATERKWLCKRRHFDLTICDFWSWSYVKDQVFRRDYLSMICLVPFKIIWPGIRREWFGRVTSTSWSVVILCVEQDGDVFKHLLWNFFFSWALGLPVSFQILFFIVISIGNFFQKIWRKRLFISSNSSRDF